MQLQRRFYEGREEASDKVPIYVAVKRPDAYTFIVNEGSREQFRELEILIWIIRYETKSNVTPRIDFDDVATYRCRGGIDRRSTVDAGIGCGALHYLKIVAM